MPSITIVRRIAVFLLAILLSHYSHSQELVLDLKSKKGDFYIDYGWNVSAYTSSDIRFQGIDYDFILKDVTATDRPSKYRANLYFNPKTFSVPQYNFRIGYFITDHLSVSIGVDHMKYVMTNGQSVQITGSTHFLDSPIVNQYDNEAIVLSEEFLQFEHTDGLNYISTDIRYSTELLEWKFISLHSDIGVGTGFLLPKTNAKILGRERHDDFNIAGYGLNSLIAFDIRFFQKFYIKSEVKGGFIHMPNIRTTSDSIDKASQAFGFAEWTFMFGVQF